MATILIADDQPLNRQYLTTLLGYKGHCLLEAADGAEALELVKAHHPDLAIVDILMPTMDGFEFVRRLREDINIAQTPVVFYTATYYEGGARDLASACGVPYVITKPAEAEVVLRTVEAVLKSGPAFAQPVEETFEREHLQLLTDKLAEKTNILQSVNYQLKALIELSRQTALERDPQRILQNFCHIAREIVGAESSAIGLLDEKGEALLHYYTSGMDRVIASRIGVPQVNSGPLGQLLHAPIGFRIAKSGCDELQGELLLQHPPMKSFLAVQIASPTKVYGFLCLINKVGREEFREADVELASAMAVSVALVYENASRYSEIQRYTADLEREIGVRTLTEQRLSAQYSVARVLAEAQTLREATQAVIQALCRTAGWEIGAIWDVDRGAGVLRLLEVSSPQAARLSEFEDITRNSTFERGAGLPGRVWASGKPLWISDVTQADNLPRAAVAAKVGLQSAFAFPIRFEDEVSGVIEFFSCKIQEPDNDLLQMFSSIGTQIAQFIERTRSQGALRQAEEKYRSIFENAAEGIFQKTPSGQILTANPAMARMLGYESPEELVSTITDIGRQVYVEPQRRSEFIRQLEEEDVVHGFETQLYRRDRSKIWVSLSGRAIRDANGTLLSCEGNMEDITERKRLEEQFRQSQKMEAVGQLAGGIAHDFNNLLTVITGYSELLLGQLESADPMRKDLETIGKAGERAAQLTRQLLAFSRKQVLQPAVLDLNVLVENLNKMLRRMIGEDIDLVTVLAPDLGPVKVDPGQVEQIIMNVAVNARDAMPRGGMLTIETSNVELCEDYAQKHIAVLPGSYVVLAVSDTGCGMDAETKAHIFEPFFTTKGPGKGTGLGLATVYGIVKQSGGNIWVYSELGQGTTFKIYFPRVTQGQKAVLEPKTSYESRGGKETVLLVEDEPGVRKLACKILQTKGYKLIEASRGAEALALCETHKGMIDLLITDVVMPDISGRELADRLRSGHPGLRLLYMSGYTDEAVIRHGVLDAGVAFLQKPFTPEALARRVRQVLDASP